MKLISTPIYKKQKCFLWKFSPFGSGWDIIAMTKSEARARLKDCEGRPIPPGTKCVKIREVESVEQVRATKEVKRPKETSV